LTWRSSTSSLSRRLRVVQQLLGPVIAELGPAQRVLSLCAGEFSEAAFAEIAFESEPQGYGVGLNRSTPAVARQLLPAQLFAFNR
jgi:hypothetical protein